MSEETLWKGSPSQMTNLLHWVGILVLVIVLVVLGALAWPPAYWALIIPLCWAVWVYLLLKCEVYELTSQRLRLYTGVLNQKIDELELYRVKDTTMERPWFLRIFGLSNLLLDTSDRSHPRVTLKAIRNAVELREKLRQRVELLRDEKRVREIDFEDDFDGDQES